MKTLKLLILSGLLSLSHAWTKIGQDIDGEAQNDKSGDSVSINSDGSIVAVGAYSNDDAGGNAGHVRVYQYSNNAWTQLGQDIYGKGGNDQAGAAVSLSADGYTIAVGADGASGTHQYSGAVRVYQYSNNAWPQIGNDIFGEAGSDFSGYSVSMSDNGNIVAIGSNKNTGNTGHVRVYQYSNNAWTQIGQDIDGEASGDRSGEVSLNADGTIVAIGAERNDGNPNDAGHVRVYQYSNNAWTQLGQDIDGETSSDYSGMSVSISSDGHTVAIGAPKNDGDDGGFDRGHVRVYKYSGGAWAQIGQDIDGADASDNSGESVSLSGDGTVLAIGASNHDTYDGHVRVYRYSNNVWTQHEGDIDGHPNSRSGSAVSISKDGTTVAIAAKLDDGSFTDAGHVRVYQTVLPDPLCAENEHVSGGACTACPTGDINPAGDDPTQGDTSCTPPPCHTHNGDEAACCAQDGCAYAAGNDCIAEADLAGNPNLCPVPLCAENEHVSGGECTACASDKVRAAGDDPTQGDTSCTTPPYVRVSHDFCSASSVPHLPCTCASHGYEPITDVDECLNAARTTLPFADGTSPDLSAVVYSNSNHNSGSLQPGCVQGGAPHSYKVFLATQSTEPSGKCTAYKNEGMHCICKQPAIFCAENEHVSGGACTACPTGDINPAGDDPTQGDTSCTTPPAVCDACPVPLDMKAVPVGTKVVCEDTSVHCSGEWVKYGGGCYHPTCTDTQSCCAPPAPCLENQHVSSGKCEACPVGRFKTAGDQPPKNSECWPEGSCGGDVCIDANTESCTNNACVCKLGFGGTTCERDVTTAGIQKMLQESRKKALPTKEDIIERQKTIKTFARDTLRQKIKQGKSVKQAITETKVVIEPQDLPQKAQAIIQQLAKVPVIAVAPANKDEEDTCDQGVDTAGCSMFDVDSDSNEIVMLSTDPDAGSWSVLASGGEITSKQTRVSEFVYEMQCWDNGWGAKETVDVSDGAKLFECNGNVIMIASQSGICTPSKCNNGNCTVDGSSYVCSCEAGWSGDHCDEVSTLSQCHEFDCSNYGGHKSLAHCGGTCSATLCCNHATKAAFDAVCDALTTSAEYVSNKCCHRDICI